MTAFIEDYIDTAVRDPAAAFEMLTPAFQSPERGLEGYEGFWGDVRSAKIVSVEADPDALEVSYRYRFKRPPGGPGGRRGHVRLAYDQGEYLIDDEV